MERNVNRRLCTLGIFMMLASCSGNGGAPLPSTRVPSATKHKIHESLSASGYSDWNTFGGNLQRTGYNAGETTLSRANVARGLKMAWKDDLGGSITDQPLVAAQVSINGTPRDVVYIGAENNVFYALDATTGAVIWKNTSLGSAEQTNCTDLPGKQFGITGTATFDRSGGVVYVADASDNVHALSMATGAEEWKTNILLDPNTNTIVGSPSRDHVYGALAFNPANGLLYAYTAGFCDTPPWYGRIVAISTTTHTVVGAFFPGRTTGGKGGTAFCGGAIWGMGGASVDPVTNDVLVATGNIDTSSAGGCAANAAGETFPFGDAVVQLDPQLNLVSFETANIKNNGDSDYGATPMLYRVGTCGALQSSTKNKDGSVYTYAVGSSLAFEQQLKVGQVTSFGTFLGVPAFDPTNGLVFVGDPRATGPYANGVNAFHAKPNCSGLGLAWRASVGGPATNSNDNQAPTVANGVVYLSDGLGDKVWAFNDTNGALLWQSGSAIGPTCIFGTTCGVFGAATIDRNVYVGSFNHNVYAFGL